MKTLAVLQHTDSEYLGLMEDHLESRAIRFHYLRPFTPGARLPASAEGYAGLVLLGAGPRGVASGDLLASLAPELRLCADFLARDLPVIGIGAGAAILAVAAGGGAEPAPLRLALGLARRVQEGALCGHLPPAFPFACYLRDRPLPPAGAAILARDEAGETVLFAVGARSFGFGFHPGIKTAMIEDLVMEFEEAPEDIGSAIARLRERQGAIAEALGPIMVGLVAATGLMEPG
ncbi:MAG: hypothetical protein ACP5NI_05590 [Acetobacteraceae bacterium]